MDRRMKPPMPLCPTPADKNHCTSCRSCFSIVLLLALFSSTKFVHAIRQRGQRRQPQQRRRCFNIAQFVCNTNGFATLCAALQATALDKVLNEPNTMYTLFAPMDQAFDNLPSGITVDSLLKNPSVLINILLFHVVRNKKELLNDLQCTKRLRMANGNKSRTVCRRHQTFQEGAGNQKKQKPEIIDADKIACNGVVHAVSEVMLPPLPKLDDECNGVAQILCNTNGFRKLCEALKATGLDLVLNGPEVFSVFAPTDVAFVNLPQRAVDLIENDSEALKDILLFHAVSGAVPSTDLQCTKLLQMANGRDSRTVCRGDQIFQKGAGNLRDQLPEIIRTDQKACNGGVVHVVSEVMLPPLSPPPPSPKPDNDDCDSITDIACNTNGFAMLCQALQITGLDSFFDGTQVFTVFAPSDSAFAHLSQGIVNLIENETVALKNILLFHATSGEILLSDLQCTKLVRMQNGKNSRTVCRGEQIFQKGAGNSKDQLPKISVKDLRACNGVIHVMNEVMLPQTF